MATYFGFNVPFFGGAQNVLSRQEDERLIKNDILQYVMTVPGERVMRPNYGTSLVSSLFEPLDGILISNLVDELETGIRNNDQRITYVKVTISPNYADKLLYLRIDTRFVIDPTKLITIEQYLNLR